MKIKDYIESKSIYIISFIFFSSLICLFFILMNLSMIYFIFYFIGSIFTFVFFLVINYIFLNINFKKMILSIKKMDNPEFSMYMYDKPKDFESRIIYEIIKEVNDKLYSKYKREIDKQNDYDDYINLWLHEIKLPIQNIKNLTNKYNDDNLVHEIEHLSFLSDKVLNLAKINFNNIVFLVNKEKIKEVINEVIRQNFNKINYEDIKVKVNVEDQDMYIDKYWINFILNQLLDNSIKYNAKTIEINGAVQGNKYIISVRDDGVGIYEEEIPYVYKKFYTGSKTNKYISSSGFGLYMVKEIVNKLNINIKIESKVNEYTYIILEIPIETKTKEIEKIVEIIRDNK